MNIVIALLIFGLIVTFHELGHFLIAKKNGIDVSEFSVGMGPRLFSFQKGGTRYSLKLFPIGGSCMMNEDDVEVKEGSFNSKGVWARISTIFAGPFFNFILAFLLALIVVGNVGYDPAVILSVPEGSTAQEVGLKEGDIITKFNGENIVFSRDVQMELQFSPIQSLQPIPITVERDGEEISINMTPSYEKRPMLGFYYDPSTNVVSSVTKGSAMDEAGVKAQDKICGINGVTINLEYTLADYLVEHPLAEESVELQYEHNGKIITSTLTPRMTENFGIGFGYNVGYQRTDFFETIRYSIGEVRYWIEVTIKSLGQLITGKVGTDDLGGPVRIVSELGNVVEAKDEIGMKYVILNLINWAILLSANLGVMNLVPIPALDGGRLLFLFIEAVRGKPIDREKEGFIHGIGFILLMVLMVFLFFNDIKNVFF